MNAKNHLYNSVKSFIINLESSDENFSQYRDVIVYKKNFEIAYGSHKNSTENAPTCEMYEADIIFKSFVMPKIEVICAVCNGNMLLKLSEKEIIDWFFNLKVPLSPPYE